MTENLRKWYTREWIILFCTIFTNRGVKPLTLGMGI
nr:MAG TPA: hypothetical protein [Caudoviricetes sp.]